MTTFDNRIAVVTGGGTGMGRALTRQLAAAGAEVAICDVSAETMAETAALCAAEVPGRRITTHLCDVSVEAQIEAFRDAVASEHDTEHIHLLFNNAGIGGGGSFVTDARADWDKTFGVCWSGVYYCSRAFLPMLIAADAAHLVNTSSVNGLWASLGPNIAHTAYSAAKFAVRGFSEALINDLHLNAPHVKVSVVMPGHIGTSIGTNTQKVLGKPAPMDLSAAEVAIARRRIEQQGVDTTRSTDDDIRAALAERARSFLEDAPLTADEAATRILEGVRAERWRILVGDDADAIDQAVRSTPDQAYEESFVERLQEEGRFWRLGHPARVSG
ncbi:MAG: SDR family NAD(P)-dependent oxidoreductase [Acidobacteriota bacterium]|nr:SDR family NAD(P)-dependent oxidoreductase [Acidobacteriota bacterium]